MAADESSRRLRVLIPRAIRTVLDEIGSQFVESTGYELDKVVDLALTNMRRIQAGESFDVFVGHMVMIEKLVAEGNIAADSQTAITHCDLAAEVPAGAPKPDVSTVEAFKQALLDATSIGYLPTTSGKYHLEPIFERLGILDEVLKKAVIPETDIVSELVAQGKLAFGINLTTQIMTTPGVQLVGRLPAELQTDRDFAAGVNVASAAPDVSRKFVSFLTSPPALAVMRAQCQVPHADFVNR